MITIRELFIFFIVILVGYSASFAQKENPFAFGNVAPEWLEDDLYADLTEEDAVILYDYGAVSFDVITSNPRVKYYFHRRIKILSEEGKKWAEVNIPIITKNPYGETVTEIKAATYNFNAVGEVVSFKVSNRKIRRNKIDKDNREVSFSLPVVKVGSVIEISYVINSKYFTTLKRWEFQDKIPTVRSEYHAFIPSRYKYVRLLQGNGYKILTSEQKFKNEAINISDLSRLGRINPGSRNRSQFQQTPTFIGGNHYVYLLNDVPALVEETFAPEANRFIPSIKLELSEDMYANRAQSNVFNTWDELNKYSDKKLKVKKKSYRKWIKSQANRLTRNLVSDRDKAVAIHEYVQRNLNWNQFYALDYGDYTQSISSKGSSSSGINLTMMHLMQEAELEVSPVLISTTDHGNVQTVYPVLSQFNHLLVKVGLSNEEILLDGVGESESFGILPKKDLNEYGFQIDEVGGSWVKLRAQNRIVKVTYSRFDLDMTGNMVGDISVFNEEYGAVLERNKFSQYTDEPKNYIKEHILIGMNEPNIIAHKVNNDGEEGKQLLKIDMELTTNDFVNIVDDLVFIKPMLSKTVTESPLKEEQRATPIDFTYPLRDAHMLGLRIPEEYEIVQLPQPIRVLLPNKGGTFVYNVIEMDHIVHLSSTILLEKTTFTPEEYIAIKDFFQYIVNKHQEDIVLKKKNKFC